MAFFRGGVLHTDSPAVVHLTNATLLHRHLRESTENYFYLAYSGDSLIREQFFSLVAALLADYDFSAPARAEILTVNSADTRYHESRLLCCRAAMTDEAMGSVKPVRSLP